MSTATLSSKFQVVIPKNVRAALKLEPGAVLNVIAYDGHIQIVPIRHPKEMRGVLRGINSSIARGKDRL